MRAYQLLSLSAMLSSAASWGIKRAALEPNLDLSVDITNDINIDPDIIGKALFEIIPDEKARNEDNPISRRDVFSRQEPGNPTLRSAEEVSKIKAPGTSKSGVFYRGDSRPPEEIFKSGFKPQGENTNLQNHLDFKPNSGLVSVSRSREATYGYMFGRSADKNPKGYVYVIAAKDMPNGYWVPGIHPPEKNAAVSRNQEFAVNGAIPATSISHAFEVTQANPTDKARKIKNEAYSLRSASKCTIMKRRAGGSCDPAGWVDIEKNEPKKPASGDGGKGKKPVGQKISQSKFLQFITELEPKSIGGLIKVLKDGEATIADVQLGFKRALSEAMDNRWADFGDWDKAAESLKNIVVDVASTVRYATPAGYWSDVIKRLPDIAKEISKGKTPKEKLEIANKKVNGAVNAWAYTPVGFVNEALMREAAMRTPAVQAVAISINKLWSYTPLGWLINQIAPIESLRRKINAREEVLSLGY
ncbi:uncharacterized protein G6M90_00g111710 [Metarhizium brunneum]|uniref:Pierisin-like domain-containing protein n=1 Tax=Metarhizium brunneum TaxID=500148 RepID=A0A7D5Z516_9HYPO